MTRDLECECDKDCPTPFFCWKAECDATFKTVEGPPIAEDESAQMPGDTENPIPSAERGACRLERGKGGGDKPAEGIPVPILP